MTSTLTLTMTLTLSMSAAASLLVACGPPVTFKDSLPAAVAKAHAWATDAQLGAVVGNGVEGDGLAHPPSGAWGYAFVSPSKLKAAVVQVFGSLVTLAESPIDASQQALVLGEAVSFSKWPIDTDSPKWYADAGWTTPSDVAESNIHQCHVDIFHCVAMMPCPVEDNAVVAHNSDTPTNGNKQVELFPTYRVFTK